MDWFIGHADVVHGTNFVVPADPGAGTVVSVHDLTPVHFPGMCNPATLAYPTLIRQALRRGAWVHTDSAFVAAEVVEAFGVGRTGSGWWHPACPPCRRWTRPRRAGSSGCWCRRGGTATSCPSARPSRARTSRGWCAPSTPSPTISATWSWSWPARAAGVRVRWPTPWPAPATATGWCGPGGSTAGSSALLGAAAVLAYPSVYEGFGFPPLQAMAAGVPVVATATGSLPEVLGDAAALVAVGDHEALAESLRQVVSDEGTRSRLVEAGRAQAARFDWARCGEGLARLYRDVADRRG